MRLERFWRHVRRILNGCGAKRILIIGKDIYEALLSPPLLKGGIVCTSGGEEPIFGEANKYGGLEQNEIFDAAVITGGLAGFDPLLLFEQVKKRVRGFVAIAVEPNFIGDARNVEWSGDGIKFGVEALKDMLDAVGFKKIEVKNTTDSILSYAWAHEPVRIFDAVSQKARILFAEIKSEAGLGAVEIGKPFTIEANIEIAKEEEAFLRVMIDGGDKRQVADSPKFSGSRKIVARCDSEKMEPECAIKLELWRRVGSDWEFASCAEHMKVEVGGFELRRGKPPSHWAFLKRLSLEHYGRLAPMACYSSGGALRLVCEFEGKKPEALGLLIKVFDKDGFILNQTAIPAPEIRVKNGGFELVCDCSSLPLTTGVYKLGVSPISYDSSVATFSLEEKDVWFEVISGERHSGEVVHSKFALDKLECVEQKIVAKPAIISVHSPARRVYWITAEPKSPVWWETTFDWTGNAELNLRFQLILPMRWTVLLDRNTRDTGLKIDLPAGRWRAIFSLAQLYVQGTALLGKVDLEKDGEVTDSRHFWLALPKIDATQDGIVLMTWKKAGEQKSSLGAQDVEIKEASEHVNISVETGEKTFVELSKIKGFEKSVLQIAPFDKHASLELPKKFLVDNKYVAVSLKPFGRSRDSTCVAGFFAKDTEVVAEPLKIEWEIE